MPKLCNFKQQYGSGDNRTLAAYEVWEDEDGNWHATLNFKVRKAEDALDAANSIARALREIVHEPPDHADKCKCLLCNEWRIYDAARRLDG